MTANTTVRPIPASATAEHTHPGPSPARARRRRNDRGFSMLELLVGMVILGILGAIGYGIYTNFIGDARDTALDQNIQTAAAELQSVLALEPTLAVNTSGTGVPGADLVTAMTNRTNFLWDPAWVFVAGDEADTVRFQFIDDGGTAVSWTSPTALLPTTGPLAPNVSWLVDDKSAVRLHITNPEGEWRCAIIVLKPSRSDIETLTAATAVEAAASAAALRGIWFDGGSSKTTDGLHDCSPVGYKGSTLILRNDVLPADAQTWALPILAGNQAAELDSSSTATAGSRTLHRSASSLDSNA